jgi:hypothetical protein
VSSRDPDYEPDYEGMQHQRDEARAEKHLHRLDNQYGRVEDWRKPKPKEQR